MPSTLDACQNYFGSSDLYGIFEIEKKASVAEGKKLLNLPRKIITLTKLTLTVKKAYYKQALKVHPDRVGEDEKEEATEKFKVLAKIHEVLSDDSKRALYDEQGIVDDDEDDMKITTWLEAFKHLFKPISESDINNYHKEYIGSELEKNDIKKAYVNGKGCINYIMEHVPFMSVEDEPRFHVIVNEMIKNEEVPEFKAFTKEPASKRQRRHKKYAREKKEATELLESQKSTQNDENDLAMQIMNRQKDRSQSFGSFLDKLAEKYATNGDEDEEEDEDDDLYEQAGKKYANKSAKKRASGSKPKKDTPIRSGRISKKK